MVLVNAIYFKGAWLHKFDPNNTYKGDFHLNEKETVKVDYMTITKKYNYCHHEELNASIVELKYEVKPTFGSTFAKERKKEQNRVHRFRFFFFQGDISMILVVPTAIEGLKQVEEKLVAMDLNSLLSEAYPKELNLTMPKFKLEQTLNLGSSLKKVGIEMRRMKERGGREGRNLRGRKRGAGIIIFFFYFQVGLNDMFDSTKADFSGISDNRELYVSDAIQKAYIEVNEEGSEAAAATGEYHQIRQNNRLQ